MAHSNGSAPVERLRRGSFFGIDNSVVDRGWLASLSLRELRLYIAAVRCCDSSTGRVHASTAKLVALSGVARKHIWDAIARLEDSGLLRVERHGKKGRKNLPNSYVVTTLQPSPDAAPTSHLATQPTSPNSGTRVVHETGTTSSPESGPRVVPVSGTTSSPVLGTPSTSSTSSSKAGTDSAAEKTRIRARQGPWPPEDAIRLSEIPAEWSKTP